MTVLTRVEKSITAENVFSDWLFVDGGSRFSLNIKGTFVATVTLQKTYDGGITIYDDEITFVKPSSDISLPLSESAQYRIGVLTGNYTSGTVQVRLGRG